MPDAASPRAGTPVSAQVVRSAIAAIVIGMLLQLVPLKYAVDATAVCGCAAWIAAAWHPTSPYLRGVWAVINALGANVGFARNVPFQVLPR